MFCTACGTALPEGARFCARCGAAVAGIPTTPLAPVQDPPRYAGFWRRAAASVVDGFVLWVPTMVSFMGVLFYSGTLLHHGPPRPQDFRATLVAYGSMWVIQWLYFAGMHSSRWQATLGKQALGIKVTTMSGERISFLRASGRFLGNLIEVFTFGIGLIMAAFTRRRQALHDIVARTIVTNITATPADVRRGLASPPVSKALMAVVLVVPTFLILGTLAAIAVPAYRDYEVRSQVTAELGRVADYKARVEARVRSGELLGGLDNESIDLPEKIDGRFVSSIEVQDGMVRVWFGEKDTTHPSLQGQVLTYTPAFHEDGGFRWLCGYAPPPPDFTVIDREYCEYTTILRRYLPGECR